MSKSSRSREHLDDPNEAASPPRIIGGDLRGKRLKFLPDPRTRPMKERVREAVFNLLGPESPVYTRSTSSPAPALGFEAISRGAVAATFNERHFPTADILKQNAVALDLSDRVTVLSGNALLWAKRLPEFPATPWVVFCSPPYDLFMQQEPEMLALIQALYDAAPTDSLFAVEADTRFDMARLPYPERWDVREYPPAVVAKARKA
ncbi:MAG: RsmD family RNA methyltransferase [Pirellulales bacterium]